MTVPLPICELQRRGSRSLGVAAKAICSCRCQFVRACASPFRLGHRLACSRARSLPCTGQLSASDLARQLDAPRRGPSARTAANAQARVYKFFLDPTTGMVPDLRFGQQIPNTAVEGRPQVRASSTRGSVSACGALPHSALVDLRRQRKGAWSKGRKKGGRRSGVAGVALNNRSCVDSSCSSKSRQCAAARRALRCTGPKVLSQTRRQAGRTGEPGSRRTAGRRAVD